jgi:hypothetical protein
VCVGGGGGHNVRRAKRINRSSPRRACFGDPQRETSAAAASELVVVPAGKHSGRVEHLGVKQSLGGDVFTKQVP